MAASVVVEEVEDHNEEDERDDGDEHELQHHRHQGEVMRRLARRRCLRHESDLTSPPATSSGRPSGARAHSHTHWGRPSTTGLNDNLAPVRNGARSLAGSAAQSASLIDMFATPRHRQSNARAPLTIQSRIPRPI